MSVTVTEQKLKINKVVLIINYSTCSRGPLAGQSQQAFLLQDETCADESARAHRQRETDVEVRTVHFHLK